VGSSARSRTGGGRPEFSSRRWSRVGGDVDRDATVELLTDSWRALLVD
jgi:hypothetical protein